MDSYSECTRTAGTSQCYWSGDVFHLETCILHSICANGAELFSLPVGQRWHCDLSEARLHEFKRLLLGM